MEIKKVKGNTFCIDTGMSYIPFYKINDKEIIMLDSGWDKEREGIDQLLEKNNFKVVGIISSHAHKDHIGNNLYLKSKYNCIIAMSSYEAYICISDVNLKVYYNNETLSGIRKHFDHMVCETDIMIQDNQDNIYVCGVKFNIIHTPGHSPAHICIVTPDDVAYVGDALISYEVMKGAKMPYAFILQEDLRSKEKLYSLKCSKYIAAHKGIYDESEINKLITDNIDFYKNRAENIYKLIDGDLTPEAILKVVIKAYNISVRTIEKYKVLKRMLISYVEYLNETGRIDLILNNGYIKYIKKNSVE